MKTLVKYTLTILLVLFFAAAFGQRGKIITPSQTNPISTSPVLDPDRNQFVSKTTAGFSNDGYYVDEFEIPMFGIPKLGGDAAGDNIGQPCGITDLIPDRDGYSVYAVRGASDNLIFRFRVGNNNPSVEAWTILIDTDEKFGYTGPNADPNATPENPGFEIDITLIKRNNAGVFLYNIDGKDNCPTPLKNYPIIPHFQISIGDEVSCGDPDYFYDFYIPFADIATFFGITQNTGLRYAAVTNTSATCAMDGNIADISGVNYNDYKSCIPCAFVDLINNQCPTAVVDLCETCSGFNASLPQKPTINEPVKAGQTTVSGTGRDGNYLKLQVFGRIGGTDQSPIWSTTPREEHVNLIVGTTWSITLNGPLQAYDRIVATAQVNAAGTGCGSFDGNAASTSVTIVNPNAAPVAQNQTVDVIEDTPKDIVLVGSDPDGDPITYSIVTQPTNGVLTGTGANHTYTPNPNYFGPDSFTFRVSDGILNSNIATVTINVLPVNDAPVANNQSVTVIEDTPKAITLTASDIENDPLTFIIVSDPTNGTLSGSGANITYTPNLNYFGPDSFTFKVNDGTVDSNIATVSITVTPVNDAPIANDQTVTVIEDTPKAITLTGSDVEGSPLTFSIVNQPTNGTLSGTGANRTYTPNPNYFGPDSFTFRVFDGALFSNVATVTINVTPVNDAPIANNQTVTVIEDTPKAITLTGSDVDNDPLTFIVVTGPTNGTLSGSGANLTYTPNLNYNGPDSFTFKVNDGTVDSNIATVTITVTPVNDAPVANNQTVDVIEDTPKAITLTASDVDGDPLTYLIVSQPTNGTLIGSGPNRTYTPNPNYFGPDSFTFQVNDGTVNSNIATVTINVLPVNDAPVANNQSVTVIEDTPKAITLTASDIENDPLTYIVVTPPSNGSLSGSGANLTYTPNLNYFGSDSFTFKVNDGTVDSNIATVSITVTPVNDDPVANDQTVDVIEDTPKSITLTGSDVDGDPLTFIIVSGPTNGALTGTGATRTYTPNLNYNGPDSFTFRVNDGTANSNIATVTINVTPVNDPPVITGSTAQTQYVLGGVIIDPTLQVTDVDNTTIVGVTVTIANNFSVGDLLIFADQNGITGSYNGGSGVLTLTGPATLAQYSAAIASIEYENDGASGSTKRITFVANDGTSNSQPWHSFITFQPNTGGPVLNQDAFATNEDVPLVTCLDVSDPDGDAVFISSFSNASGNGVFTLDGGECFTFAPTANFFGTETADVTICDIATPSICITYPITINVLPVNDPPVANNQSVTVIEDTPKAITLTASDIENDPLTYTVVTPPSNGSLSGSGANLTYTPNLNYSGPDSFTFKVNDGTDDSNIATVSITVTPENDAPVADDQVVEVIEDTPKAITLTGSDPDGDPLTFILVAGPANGVLSGSGANLTYTPNANYFGADSFTFKVNDGTEDSNIATVSINVLPVNDKPVANDQVVVVIEDTPKDITLTGSDIENDPLTFTVITFPANGTLTGTAPNLTYTPNLNYFGPDSFTFIVNDGLMDSDIATVSISVTPVNDPPVAVDDMITTPEDTPVTFSITTNDTDVDGTIDGTTVDLDPSTPSEDKTFSVTGEGTYSVDNSGNVTFTPALNYNGTTTPVSYTVKDNNGTLSNVATITIVVTPVNDPPVITPQVVSVDEDENVTVCLTVSDVEGDPSELMSGVSLTGNGTVALDTVGGKLCFVYTPDPDYNGPDQVEVSVCDKNDPTVCTTQTIDINVIPVNDKPVIIIGGVPADSLFLSTPEDTDLFFCFEFQDVDGDNTSVDSYTNTSGGGTFIPGSGNPNEHCFTFTPIADYFGKSIWDVRICDDGTPSLCTKLIVVIDVTPVNDLPEAFDQTVDVLEDTPKVVTLNGSDPDGDPLTYIIVSNPTNGSLTGTTQNVTYTPAQDYFGSDSFTFMVNDGTANSNVATVTINVLPVNDPPVITVVDYIPPLHYVYEDSVYDASDDPDGVCLSVIDVDGDNITYDPNPTNVKGGGIMILRTDIYNFCYLFTPPPNYNGESVWDFSVSDGTVSVGARVKIHVLPVNDPPVAKNDYYEVRSGVDTTFNVLQNDLPIIAPFKEFYDIYEADSVDALSVTQILAGPYNGTASILPTGELQYKSNFGYMGADSVRYRMCDSGNLCETAVVFIEVLPAPFRIYEALSPNGDGLNDYWRIDGIEAFPNNRVRVFDRYNNMVFQTRGYANEGNNWQGQANHGLIGGKLPDGTYFYSVELGNGSGILSGFVLLKDK